MMERRRHRNAPSRPLVLVVDEHEDMVTMAPGPAPLPCLPSHLLSA